MALNPVHASAIWTLVLGHLRQANHEHARAAFQHVSRVRRVLSPGYDDSFVGTFVQELGAIEAEQAELRPIVQEIRSALQGTDKDSPTDLLN